VIRDRERVVAQLLRVPSPSSQLRSADDGAGIGQEVERSHAGKYGGALLDQRPLYQEAAAATSSATFFSTSGVHRGIAKPIGQMSPSSSRAASWNSRL
jgi:hypothetical protein